MKTGVVLCGVLCVGWMGMAEPETIELWPGEAPGALGDGEEDKPTLTIYRAEEPSGAVMVICPGGGYGGLAGHEGKDYAEWLNEHGVMGVVLKYRLGSHGYRHPRMLEDVSRAIRHVRAHADEWEVDPERVGVMGSSAGGHLASTVLTQFDEGDPAARDPVEWESSRPSLGVLCYPVITMGAYTHAGSKRNLLGEKPAAALVWDLSSELRVSPRTPPVFLWHTAEDAGVPVENSLMFAGALSRAGVPFELHVYEKGRHGLGLGDGHAWTEACLAWLKAHGFVKPAVDAD